MVGSSGEWEYIRVILDDHLKVEIISNEKDMFENHWKSAILEVRIDENDRFLKLNIKPINRKNKRKYQFDIMRHMLKSQLFLF